MAMQNCLPDLVDEIKPHGRNLKIPNVLFKTRNVLPTISMVAD
jgi:hypothetical protein